MEPLRTDLSGELLLIGLSHRTAPLALRERCAIPDDRLEARLASLRSLEGVAECFALSTCNRTEVLVSGHVDERLESVLVDLVFHGSSRERLYVHRGLQALIHCFRVAGGLDSLVLGEGQILAQMREALAAARSAGTIGRVLGPLLEQALGVGKRIRNETAIGLGTLSVARVGVDLAKRVFSDFAGARVLLVGAGETGLLVAKHLVEQGVREPVFANRTEERAREAAQRFGGSHCGLDDLGEEVPRADLLVTCLEGVPNLITQALFDRRRLNQRDRPMLALDLSVPRAIDPRAGELDNLLLYDMDDLAAVVERNQVDRERAVEETSGILVAEVHKYLSLRSYAAVAPSLSGLRTRFESLREMVLDEIAGARSSSDQMRLAHELTRRLLDAALAEVKDSFRKARSEEELEREYRRYLEGL